MLFRPSVEELLPGRRRRDDEQAMPTVQAHTAIGPRIARLLPALAVALTLLAALALGGASASAQTRRSCAASHTRAHGACTRDEHAAKHRKHHGKAKHHAKHKSKAKAKPKPPAVTQVPAICEDGSEPTQGSAGSYACEDGSEPVCEDGSEPKLSSAGVPQCTETVAAGEETEECGPGTGCAIVAESSGEANCEDGATPWPLEEGTFFCMDGSQPACEEGEALVDPGEGLPPVCDADEP
jgi:hypothetical protein